MDGVMDTVLILKNVVSKAVIAMNSMNCIQDVLHIFQRK